VVAEVAKPKTASKSTARSTAKEKKPVKKEADADKKE